MNRQILTLKVKHGMDVSREMDKAKNLAKFIVYHKYMKKLEYQAFKKIRWYVSDFLHRYPYNLNSSRYVRDFGLKSMISNQILKKYKSDNIKHIKSVKLIIPHQGIKIKDDMIWVPSLKMELPMTGFPEIIKINQIEVDYEYAYIACTLPAHEGYEVEGWIGVDLNVTGHAVVAANPQTGKVLKMGKMC